MTRSGRKSVYMEHVSALLKETYLKAEFVIYQPQKWYLSI
jgi:hypothetical protein